MSHFILRQLEEERHKLNQLGMQSLEQFIPLSQNEAVQEQSRKVDELIIRYARQQGGTHMNVPPWFLQIMEGRLEEVAARIERHADFGQVRGEEDEAFQALFDSVDVTRIPEFVEWEDKHYIRQGMQYERLYLQGLQDGVQLAVGLLFSPGPFEGPMPGKG